MSDFLGNIVARSLGTVRGIRPRAIPVFAEEDAPGIREVESSLELDHPLPYRSRPLQPDPLEAFRHPSPEDSKSAAPAQLPARRLHSDTVSPSPITPTQTRPESPIPPPLNFGEQHRPSPEPTLHAVKKSALPGRPAPATPPAIFEASAPAAEPAPHRTAPADPAFRTPPPSPAAQTRDQPPSPVPPPGAQVPVRSAVMPGPAPAPSSEAVLAPISAARHAPDLSSVFTETRSNAPALRPGSPAPFTMESNRPPRHVQSLRQSARQAASPAEPDIHITIGRVDVRANLASPTQEKKDRTTSSLQLADYLKRRDGSGSL